MQRYHVVKLIEEVIWDKCDGMFSDDGFVEELADEIYERMFEEGVFDNEPFMAERIVAGELDLDD